MVRTRVLISCIQMQRVLASFEAEFAQHDIELVVPTITGQQLSEVELLKLMPEIDGVIAGDDPFTSAVLSASPRLRTIAKWGIGTDSIDRQTAESLGILVTNTAGVFDDEVADTAIGYVLLLARQLHQIDARVRAGQWFKPRGETLRGKVLSLLGLGAIGRGTAVRAQAFGMSVVGADPSPDAQKAATDMGISVVDLDTAAGAGDYFVIAASLSASSEGLVDARLLRLMPPGSRIINVARGRIIDETDLIEALQDGHLAGAALDVFVEEPPSPDNPLLAMDAVILGSHNSSNTAEGVSRASSRALENLLTGLSASKRFTEGR